MKVHFDPLLRDFTNNQDTVEVNGNTVGQCLKDLVKQFPSIKQWIFDEHGKLLDDLLIFVNGEFFASGARYREKVDEPIRDEDEIYLLFALGGG